MHLLFDGVTCRFRDDAPPALDRVSLTVRAGELTAIVGPPGAGKSTLLRMAAGCGAAAAGSGPGAAVGPGTGKVGPGPDLTAGLDVVRDAAGAPPRPARHAPQGQSPLDVVRDAAGAPPLTPTEGVVRFGADAIRSAGASGRDASRADSDPRARPRADSAARAGASAGPDPDAAGGAGRGAAVPGGLVLVDDLVGRPEYPDAAARRAHLRALHRPADGAPRRTVLYATRNGRDALAVADRIAVLEAGRLVQAGTPAEVHDRPATERVAQAFGDPPITLVPAILEKDGQAVLIGNRTVSLAGCIAEAFCRDVTVGVRPQYVQLDDRPGPGWRGRVAGSAPTGDRALVTVDAEGVRLRALTPAPYPAGAEVVVRILPRHWLVFDDRGVRLDPT